MPEIKIEITTCDGDTVKFESKDEKYERLSASSRFLQKEKVLGIGLKETLK